MSTESRWMASTGTIHKGGSYLFERPQKRKDRTTGKMIPVIHAGVDISAKRGTMVVSPTDGVIVAVERKNRSPFRGYGPETVVIRDDDGKFHLLAHLEPSELVDPRTQRTKPGEGKRVATGRMVGTIGKFNHVHWEVRRTFLPDYSAGEFNEHISEDPVAWAQVDPTSDAHEGYQVVVRTAADQPELPFTMPTMPSWTDEPAPSPPKKPPKKPAKKKTDDGWLWLAIAWLVFRD